MNKNILNQAIIELQLIAPQFSHVGAKVIDKALAQVMAHRDKACILPLLYLLDDSTQQDEGMFSIIHAVESFDDKTYVKELLVALPKLRLSSPKWASILLMRGLNNENIKKIIVQELERADREIKDSAAWLCEKINERNPKFLQKTMPVLLAAR